MEGLKSLAEATFDRTQKFRSLGSEYRYNVIEIGVFEPPPASSADNHQHNGSSAQAGGGSNSTTNASKTASTATASAAPSRKPSISAGSTKSSVTAATSGNNGSNAGSAKDSFNEWVVYTDDLPVFMKKRPVDYITVYVPEPQSPFPFFPPHDHTTTNNNSNSSMVTLIPERKEIHAIASLKLICIQRDPRDGTLGIAKPLFTKLMSALDADPSVLYLLARNYDGFHEYGGSEGLVTSFIGTGCYALVWTFNRRTLATRALCVMRKPRESFWFGFRDVLRTYRGGLFTVHLLGFVSSVFLLRFCDEESEVEAGRLKEIERWAGFGEGGSGNEDGTARIAAGSVGEGGELGAIGNGSASASGQGPGPGASSALSIQTSAPERSEGGGFDIGRVAAWSQTTAEVTGNISNKLRHLNIAKGMLEMIAQEHETKMVDSVAKDHLHKYHMAMEGMNEAITPIKRHMEVYEDYLLYMKDRAKSLNSLLFSCLTHLHSNEYNVALSSPSIDPRADAENQRDGSSPWKTVLVMSLVFFSDTLLAAVLAGYTLRWGHTKVEGRSFWVYLIVILASTVAVIIILQSIKQRRWLMDTMRQKGRPPVRRANETRGLLGGISQDGGG